MQSHSSTSPAAGVKHFRQEFDFLTSIFPLIDPGYLSNCLSHYPIHDPNRLEHVTHKIIMLNHGYYPTIVAGTGPSVDSVATKNSHLRLLSDLFPALDLSYLRSLIDSNNVDTVMSVAESLLNKPPTPRKSETKKLALPRRDHFGVLTEADMFRSSAYVNGARARLFNAFPHLWKSSIKAYLAEHNFDYIRTYMTLSNLSTARRTVLNSLLSSLFKRPTVNIAHMYDADLMADVDKLRRVLNAQQVISDEKMAFELNAQHATETCSLFECVCCLDDVAWENVVACKGSDPHLVCTTCIHRGMNELVYGQGRPTQSALTCFAPGQGCCAGYAEEDLIRAVRINDESRVRQCSGAACNTEQLPATYIKYCTMQARVAASHAGLSIHECPICGYFTVSGPRTRHKFLLHLPPGVYFAFDAVRQFILGGNPQFEILVYWMNPVPILAGSIEGVVQAHMLFAPRRRRGYQGNVSVIDELNLLMMLCLRWVAAMFQVFAVCALVFGFRPSIFKLVQFMGGLRVAYLSKQWNMIRTIYRREFRRMAADWNHPGAAELLASGSGDELGPPVQVFTCTSAACRKQTCMQCHSEFLPFHKCHDPLNEPVAKAVELAMSRAIKRVCPSCYLSFTKSDGCNLMTCPQCQYIMCYVCRREIGTEKYAHFCQHFRAAGGKCRECNKCELYAAEDERFVRQQAGWDALHEWHAVHPAHKLTRAEVRAVHDLIGK